MTVSTELRDAFRFHLQRAHAARLRRPNGAVAGREVAPGAAVAALAKARQDVAAGKRRHLAAGPGIGAAFDSFGRSAVFAESAGLPSHGEA